MRPNRPAHINMNSISDHKGYHSDSIAFEAVPNQRRTVSSRLRLSSFPAAGANFCSSSEVESGAPTTVSAVTAVTVDFFRKGSYSSALPATAPMFDSSHQRKPKLMPLRDAAIANSQEEISRREAASTGGRERSDWAGREGSDTEAAVCVLWLQVNSDVLIFLHIFTPRCLQIWYIVFTCCNRQLEGLQHRPYKYIPVWHSGLG